MADVPKIELELTAEYLSDETERIVATLVSNGFSEAGAFRVPGLANALVVGLVHVKDHLYAAVYDYEAQSFTDIIKPLGDGATISFSNGPVLASRAHPRHGRVNVGPEVRAPNVHKQALEEAGDMARVAVSSDGFSACFERLHQELASHHADPGQAAAEIGSAFKSALRGFTDALGIDGGALDSMLEETFGAMGIGDDEVTAACRSAFATKLDIEEEDLDGALIHAEMAAWEAWDELEVSLDDLPLFGSEVDLLLHWGNATFDDDSEAAPFEVLAQLQERLPEGKRFEEVSRIDEPVAAVYLTGPKPPEEDPIPVDEGAADEARTRIANAAKMAKVKGSVEPWGSIDGKPVWRVEVAGDHAMDAWQALRDRVGYSGHWPVVIGHPVGELGDDVSVLCVDGYRPGASAELIALAEALDLDAWIAIQHEEQGEDDDDDVIEAEFETEDDTPRKHIIHHAANGAPAKRVAIALFPTRDPSHVAALLRYGRWHACPAPEVHVAALGRWNEKYGAELLGIAQNCMELHVTRPPEDAAAARELALELYGVCPELVDHDNSSVARLGGMLRSDSVWRLWWDDSDD